MGEFSVYCALCAGPIDDIVRVGSTSNDALRRRDRFVQSIREGSEADWEDFFLPEDEDEFDFEEATAYDPRLVDDGSSNWLEDLVMIGYNARANTTTKGWISKQVRDGDGNLVKILGGADEDITDYWYSCYFDAGGDDGHVVFPAHATCMKLLALAITGQDDIEKLDLDAVYLAMAQSEPQEFVPNLRLDYGPIRGCRQDWECVPGEEYCVADPFKLPVEDLKALVTAKLAKKEVSREQHLTLDTTKERQIKDPFDLLPEHLVYSIISYLPEWAFLDLRAASWPIYLMTSRKAFWLGHIRTRMPWFWELPQVIAMNDELQDNREIYDWLRRHTAPTVGAPGPLLGLINRRRIWNVCLQLGKRYFHARDFRALSEVDNSITSTSTVICQHHVMLNMDQPLEPSLSGSQNVYFNHSWDEMQRESSIFEVYSSNMGDHTRIVGFGIICGQSRRFWGIDGNFVNGITYEKEATLLASISEIRRMIFRIHNSAPDDYIQNGPKSYISAIQIFVRVGGSRRFGRAHPDDPERGLMPTTGHGIVGVASEVFEEHVGGHTLYGLKLGLLEAPNPESPQGVSHPNDDYRTRPAALKYLWSLNGNTSQFFQKLIFATVGRMISMDVVCKASHPETAVAADLTPMSLLQWGENPNDIENITQLSFRTLAINDAGDTTVIGLRLAFRERYWEPKRYAGPKELACHNGENDKGATWEVFELDGPDGERLIEIAVDSADQPQAIRVKTNRQRTFIAGTSQGDAWVPSHVPADQDIIGLGLSVFTQFLDPIQTPRIHSLAVMSRDIVELSESFIAFQEEWLRDGLR